jgi:hypothetical protein
MMSLVFCETIRRPFAALPGSTFSSVAGRQTPPLMIAA